MKYEMSVTSTIILRILAEHTLQPPCMQEWTNWIRRSSGILLAAAPLSIKLLLFPFLEIRGLHTCERHSRLKLESSHRQDQLNSWRNHAQQLKFQESRKNYNWKIKFMKLPGRGVHENTTSIQYHLLYTPLAGHRVHKIHFCLFHKFCYRRRPFRIAAETLEQCSVLLSSDYVLKYTGNSS
jgi:hypothetical protein